MPVLSTLFAHPGRLWLAAGLIPLALWLRRGSRLRSREWGELGLSGRVPGNGSWGWLAAMALVILALGQPRWGRVLGLEAPAGHDVVLVVDVSRSMGAEDALPDRLGVAIDSASSLLLALEASAGNRAAVVAFAGRGVVRCPLTSSLDSALEVLRSLKVGEVEPGGTDLGAALDVALGAFDEEEHLEGRTIVVFSDGEDHVGSWTSALDRLRAGGVMVHSVAIGDPEKGVAVPSPGPVGLEPPNETRRSDLAITELAKGTGGALIPLGLVSADLGSLFREKIEPTARLERDALRLPERVERFPAFLLAAVGSGLAASWPGRGTRSGRRYLLAIAVAVVVGLATLGAGPSVDGAPRQVALGRTAYDAGRFLDALEAFEQAIRLEPKAAIPRYDAASALFQLHRYPEAVARYEEALKLADDGLAIKVNFALGNARLAQGDIAGAVAGYDACLVSTLAGASFDAVRDDARVNRDFAVNRIPPQPEKPEGGGLDPPSSKRPKPSQGSPKGDPGDRSPSPSTSTDSPPQGQAGSEGGSRGAGGAGGGGQPPPPPLGSPDSRLDSVLKDIREARSRRPPDSPAPASKRVAKDW